MQGNVQFPDLIACRASKCPIDGMKTQSSSDRMTPEKVNFLETKPPNHQRRTALANKVGPDLPLCSRQLDAGFFACFKALQEIGHVLTQIAHRLEPFCIFDDIAGNKAGPHSNTWN